jgi:hypothetical protein
MLPPNPFAFPSEFRYVPAQQGMGLRDYFAAHAPDPPSGWMGTADTLERLSRPDGKIAALIEWRWFYADAMLAGRDLPKQEVVPDAVS